MPRWFLDESDEERREVGVLLFRLRDRRRKADYEDEVSGLPNLAQLAVGDAQLAVDRLATL